MNHHSSSASTSSSSLAGIRILLEKTKHYDKDERYMATSDLCEVLKRLAESSSQNHQNQNQSTTTTNTNVTTLSSTGGGNSRGRPGNGPSNNNNHNNIGGGMVVVVLDSEMEKQVCNAVLNLLHDRSNDVQAIAVNTLSVLLKTVSPEQVLVIANSLMDQVLDASKTELRDVYTIGLRTLVKDIPLRMGQQQQSNSSTSTNRGGSGSGNVTYELMIRLQLGIRESTNIQNQYDPFQQEITLACFDVLTDLLSRFGNATIAITHLHESILQVCLQQLQVQSSNDHTQQQPPLTARSLTGIQLIRKRAGNAIGVLSTVLSDTLLHRMVESVLQQIDQSTIIISSPSKQSTTTIDNEQGGDVRALIRTMCTVAGAVGHRLGQVQIDRIIPIFLKFTKPNEAIHDHDNNNDHHHRSEDNDSSVMQLKNELRESCFMGYESFLMRCSKEVEPHLSSIIEAALAYMQYDPNYSYDDDDNDEEEGTTMQDDDNNMDEDEDGGDDEDDDEYDSDDDDDDDVDDADDDDESWKVRRSAIRVLRAVVEAKKEDPIPVLWQSAWQIQNQSSTSSTTIAKSLLSRFKEREENCRIEVIECLSRLLAVTIGSSSNNNNAIATTNNHNTGVSGGVEVAPAVVTVHMNQYLNIEFTIKVVRSCEKIFIIKKGNDRSKSSCLALLTNLCRSPTGIGTTNEIMSLFKHLRTFLVPIENDHNGNNSGNMHRDGTSKALRLDTLHLVHAILESSMIHNNQVGGGGVLLDGTVPRNIRRHVKDLLLRELCEAVKEKWYKVIAEALRVLAVVPLFFTSIGYMDETSTITTTTTMMEQEQKEVGSMLFHAIEPLLAAYDVDQEIKECALNACASLLSSLHHNMEQQQTNRLLSLLLDRLKNETTRLVAIKTLSSIATTSSSSSTTTTAVVLLSPILSESIETMASFLKLSSRSLQQSSLEAIDKLIMTSYPSTMITTPDSSMVSLFENVLRELTPLLSDKDMHLCHLSLRATVSILNACPAAGAAVERTILDPLLVLSTSSSLHDTALHSLLLLFQGMLSSTAIDFHILRQRLLERLTPDITKHGIYNLSKCIAVITVGTTTENQQIVLNAILSQLNGLLPGMNIEDYSDLRQAQLSLLTSGDIGRMVNFEETHYDVGQSLKTIFRNIFDSPSDDLRNAASYALGNASVGTPSIFLEAILDDLDNNSNKKHQYLLLSALREFINCNSRKKGNDRSLESIPSMLPKLINRCSDEEEGIRNMVAECLGSIASLQPEVILPTLETLQNSHFNSVICENYIVPDDDDENKRNARICWTIATSIKIAVAGKGTSTQLATSMRNFIKLLQIKEINCRSAALLMIYSTVHHLPQLMSSYFEDIISPTLYEIADLKLVRNVDLGPFKHTIDDALPLRKVVLSIFATCLENLPGSLDIKAFMQVLAKALNDAEDIQLHAHQILITMCTKQPSYVHSSLDLFISPLGNTLNKKQGNKVGTELERFHDWMKSALRVIKELHKLDGLINPSPTFSEFYDQIMNNPKFTMMLQTLVEEELY